MYIADKHTTTGHILRQAKRFAVQQNVSYRDFRNTRSLAYISPILLLNDCYMVIYNTGKRMYLSKKGSRIGFIITGSFKGRKFNDPFTKYSY